MAPDPKTTAKFIPSNNANRFKAAVFHTMAFKLSLEINTEQVTIATKRSFLKILYNVCKIKKKNIAFEQYASLHLDGPKIVIWESASNMVFILNSSFASTDEYFKMAIAEACEAFNKTLVHFGYTQILEVYDPKLHQVNPQQTHAFYQMDFHLNFHTILFTSLFMFNHVFFSIFH